MTQSPNARVRTTVHGVMRRFARTRRSLRFAVGLMAVAARVTMTATGAAEDPAANPPLPGPVETVMVVGGSAAYGWDDPHNNSYLHRALLQFSIDTGVDYAYDDRTQIGGKPTALAPQTPGGTNEFAAWLAQDQPQVVMLSWGLLNDISANTPVPAFEQAVQDEIVASRRAHAVVILVTPPPVVATSTSQQAAYDTYVAAEHAAMQAAVQITGSRGIYWMDLNQAMTTYLQAHGETLQPFVGDNWHPNQAGQELAGHLLYDQLKAVFGAAPIHPLPPGAATWPSPTPARKVYA